MALEIFKGYNVTKKDLAHYEKLIADGDIEQAISEFIDKYIRPFVSQYEQEMLIILQRSLERELTQEQQNKTALKISALSAALSVLITTNFSKLSKLHIETLKKIGLIDARKMANITEKHLVENFNILTKEAMTRTNQNIINNIRNVQRAIAVDTAGLIKRGIQGVDLEAAKMQLKNTLLKRFPQYQEMLKTGNFLLSRDNKKLNLNSYIDMSVRTTLLNVDRDIAENEARINDDEVVEYYKADKRIVKEPRVICQHILQNKVNGKSLLALNENAARKYGIMTIEQAKSEGAMGPNCTHSFKSVSRQFMKELEAANG